MSFRDNRKTQELRDAKAETSLSSKDFILPYFVVDGQGIKQEITGLEDVYHFSLDQLLIDLEATVSLGIDKILLFANVGSEQKDSIGSAAYSAGNLISQAVKNIKAHFPDLMVITDVCLCGYTDHGHCGVVEEQDVSNEKTLGLLAKMALLHAYSGADMVAPSAMMDFQVKEIRQTLRQAGLRTRILSYSAKYASVFYGPFRGAAGSAPSFGDRKTYQMDPRNALEAEEESQADVEEGADWLMVKPAVHYLDVIRRLRTRFSTKKVAAYHVSGEYMLWKLGANQGLFKALDALEETLMSIKRAGADFIITYAAREYLQGRGAL